MEKSIKVLSPSLFEQKYHFVPLAIPSQVYWRSALSISRIDIDPRYS